MSKQSKISFTMYGNEKLKPVNFHGKMIQPLYIRLVFDRNNTIFKSYYFDLLSHNRFALSFAGKKRSPTVAEIEAQEEILLNFIINKLGDGFTLESFKQAYAFYSQDFCKALEPDFNQYLYTFFNDKGMPEMATISTIAANIISPFSLLRDYKRALQKPLYEELIENAVYYAPPYLPLYDFMDKVKPWPMKFLSLKEWESQEFSQQFQQYLENNYSKEQQQETMTQIAKWVEYLRREAFN